MLVVVLKIKLRMPSRFWIHLVVGTSECMKTLEKGNWIVLNFIKDVGSVNIK